MDIGTDKNDEIFMKRALALSLQGTGYVRPNPLVGAVIVRDGQIIGEGYHEKFGGPHAEINALNKCILKGGANGGTIYVTLEPCSFYGKTPPCTDALIKSGIRKVVCAMTDPNPLVSGSGFKKLEEAGISVVNGVLENDAKIINEEYIKFITTQNKG